MDKHPDIEVVEPTVFKEKHKTPKQPFFKNKYNILFLITLAVIIFLRLRYLFQGSIWVDETAYTLDALRFLTNGSFSPATPFAEFRALPVIITVFWGFFFDVFTAGRLMALTLTIAGLIAAYLIGKEAKNELTGIIAILLIGLNPYIWFHSSRTLIDAPVAFMVIISAYFLIRLEKQFSTKNLIYLIIAVALTMQTKFVGALTLFVILFYYLIKLLLLEKHSKSYLKKVFATKSNYIIIAIFLILAYFVKDHILWGIRSIQYNSFFIDQMTNMITTPVLILAAIGAITTILYKKRAYLIILITTLTYYAAFSLLPAGPYPRYILPGVAPLLIVAAIGVTEIAEFVIPFIKTKKTHTAAIVTIIFLILTLPTYYETANSMILRMSYPFTGYDKAGEWIKENVPDDAIVFTMSTAWANLFAKNTDNRIKIDNTARFNSQEDLEAYLKNVTQPFYLITDNWEAGAQPRWLTPTQENVQNIINMGFNPVHIITQKYPINDQQLAQVYQKIRITSLAVDDRSLEDIPVIFIFERIQEQNLNAES